MTSTRQFTEIPVKITGFAMQDSTNTTHIRVFRTMVLDDRARRRGFCVHRSVARDYRSVGRWFVGAFQSSLAEKLSRRSDSSFDHRRQARN